MKEIGFSNWLTDYKPIKNPVLDPDGNHPFKGYMFNASRSDETIIVDSYPLENIWYLVIRHNAELFLFNKKPLEGRGFVTLGYFVTIHPHDKDLNVILYS